MDINVINRLILSLVIIGLGYVLYRLVDYWTLHRAHDLPPGLESLPQGVLGILYFTTPTCMPCKTVQRPAIETVKGQLGTRLQVIEVDATQQTELADSWGVLSVPTTVIIDAHGKPRKVNRGVTTADQLLRQLQESE